VRNFRVTSTATDSGCTRSFTYWLITTGKAQDDLQPNTKTHILRLLCLLAPENAEVRDMVAQMLERLKTTCFGNADDGLGEWWKGNGEWVGCQNDTQRHNYCMEGVVMNKISIRFFDDAEVRAVWDDANSKWWFSVLDIVGVLRGESDYEKNRNYWKYLKEKLKRDKNQLGSVTTQFKFTAPDGKKRAANVLDYDGIIELAKKFSKQKSKSFYRVVYLQRRNDRRKEQE